ncbi:MULTISPECIES: HAMP domain-containing sensor histidine kinase [Caproicibacterium]|nr:ATP-binding protein [Caproicibacterium lactatifermentans]MDD4807971.1 ATP-binding protein [Oscillospiraceae bacterium]
MKKKMALLNVLIVVVSFVAAFLLCAFQLRSQYQREFSRRLDAVLSLSSLESEQFAENPQKEAQRLGSALQKAGQQVRVSIIERSGRVIGDSECKDIHENHLQRPEVQQALHSGRGYDLRQSETTHEGYLYAAQRVNAQYILRAALRTTEMDTAMRNLAVTAGICLAVGIFIACAATLPMLSHTFQPLQELTSAAEEISRGNYSSRMSVKNPNDEVGRLARSFNRMSCSTENAILELRHSQSRLKSLLEGMDDGVLAIDGEGRVLFFNERLRKLLSCPNLAVGSSLDSSLLLNHVGRVMQQARISGVPYKEQIAGVTEGQQFTVYAAVAEEDKCVLAVVSDISRMKRLEQMRSEFVGNVTHELKTPLTSIRASIELLKSENRDAETRAYFYDVLDMEAERLQHLIDDMLALSRLENMREDPAAHPVSVAKAVAASVKRLKPAAQKNEVTVSCQVDPALYVCCSPMRLEQLFGNLIENAVKYNRPGGTVTVTGAVQREAAAVRVQDTGIGIAPQHIPRLFERFYRVDTSRSREIGGTGLGLSIVKHIAVLYGGDISVESKVGEGSTFTVRLPLACPKAENNSLPD